MADTSMESSAWLGKRLEGADPELLRELVQGVVEQLMAAEAQAICGAEYGQRSEGRLYPHLIRHSAITWMVSRGMQPVAICDIVGCSLPVVMEVYTHLGDEQRYRAMMDVLRDED